MALQECGKGHIYDTDIYPQCPYCRKVANSAPFGGLDYGATVAPQGYAATPVSLDYGATVAPQGYTAPVSLDYGATVAPQGYAPAADGAAEAPAMNMPVTEAPAMNMPVTEAPVQQTPVTEAPTAARQDMPADVFEGNFVGWLVCIRGAQRGRDFRIGQKRNTIGKSERADIRLVDEDNNRFAIWARLDYLEDENACLLQPISTGKVLLNGAPVSEPVQLRARDVVCLGGCDYLYIPLCGEDFRWEDA